MRNPLDAADLRSRVQECVDAELATQAAVLAEVGPDTQDLLAAVRSLLAGGKRLRAAFLYWGYRAAGQPDSPALVRLATAMEFFQAAALIHDDVMDDSDTRRGLPAAHRALAARHSDEHWSGDADRFGVAGAILAGNLCLNWTEELFATSGLPAEHLARGRSVFDRMRTQLMGGQFLDVVESVRSWEGLSTAERIERASRVIRYKSAKYTIEHPLLIGATAGGAGEADLAALSRYGLDLGHAFQLRDDLLGVFGDPAATGKPAGDDLREGKRTVLIAHTLEGADAHGRAVVEAGLGRPDLDAAGVEAMRRVIVDSGAVDAVEAEIAGLADAARLALKSTSGLADEPLDVLDALIDFSTARSA
ncbi:polyprenyl synthetase family protein [Knoellia sp. p5-6-4]|uniref:polyprenyl synthetase family protein n=1 Tax=unclassified Knoellia TaxID=2618719 RepID=UPI0023DC01A1|nr:polyprenyl synthetase family protein [Knoellia sp. p5-6-4]MDF2143624.1 polyprenyl synthetase family protein [Knoellia sp. p5-6-4]